MMWICAQPTDRKVTQFKNELYLSDTTVNHIQKANPENPRQGEVTRILGMAQRVTAPIDNAHGHWP